MPTSNTIQAPTPRAYNIGPVLTRLLQESLEREAQRVDDNDDDDTEGQGLMESPFGSPLSSVTASPSTSPMTSPFGSPLTTPASSPPPSSTASTSFSSPMSTRPSSPVSHIIQPPMFPALVSQASNTRKRAFSLSLYDSSDDAPCDTASKERVTQKKKKKKKRRAHQQQGYRKRRAWKRQEAKHHPSTQKIRASLPENYPDLSYLPTNFDVTNLAASKPGFIGIKIPRVKSCRMLQDYVDEGFEVIEWDGKETFVLVDDEERIFAACVSPPTDGDDWDSVTMTGFHEAMRQSERQMHFGSERDRRGNFDTDTFGFSFGGGRKIPGVLKQSRHNMKVDRNFMCNRHVRRVFGYANAMFRYYFPQLYGDYVDLVKSLEDMYPDLRRPTPRSVFMGKSKNYGTRSPAQTVEHLDMANKANGICPIISSGDFNPKTGGHLSLPQLKLLIEFPPGTFILIPSATLIHGNVPVLPGEHRDSMTMFTAGGLFRWVEYGGRTEKTMRAEDPVAWKAELEKRKTRWSEHIGRFSTLDSLKTDQYPYLSKSGM